MEIPRVGWLPEEDVQPATNPYLQNANQTGTINERHQQGLLVLQLRSEERMSRKAEQARQEYLANHPEPPEEVIVIHSDPDDANMSEHVRVPRWT